ncbi:MAG: flagellar motor protein MotB [Chromatiales bacterium]|nr:flagellar motor protein MotB [Chromatiales bacterium]
MEACECEEVKCPPPGAPAWVMTFADLMSLLMCFFVLLLSFSEMDVQKFKQIAGSMESAFGVQRDVKANDSPKGISIIAQEFSPGKPEPTPISEVRQTTTIETPNLELLKNKDDKKGDGSLNIEGQQKDAINKAENNDAETESIIAEMASKAAQSEASVSEINEAIAETIVKAKQKRLSAEYAKQLNKQLETEVADGLISIESKDESIIIRIKEKGSFGSGSATLKDEFYVTMERITEEIANTPGRITISGHTDNIPISTARFRSNWELASSRAVSVLDYMTRSGLLDPANLEVVGYADTQPLVPNDSAANRATNRRIEIKLTPAVKPIFGQ